VLFSVVVVRGSLASPTCTAQPARRPWPRPSQSGTCRPWTRGPVADPPITAG